MSLTSRQRDPAELLREIHAALDLVERNLNQLPWRSETGSHIDLVVQLRNRIIATYPHEMAAPEALQCDQGDAAVRVPAVGAQSRALRSPGKAMGHPPTGSEE